MPPAPVVTSWDCSTLPQSKEGDDPLNTRFWIHIKLDLSCADDDVNNPIEEGMTLEMEYYDEEDGSFSNTRVAWTSSYDNFWKVTSSSHGTPVDGLYGTFAYDGLPRGEDVTLVAENKDSTRSITLVVQIDPPYAALKSVTEN